MRRVVAAMLVAGVCSLAGTTGCAKPSKLTDTWGDAYRANREAIVVNPHAGEQAPHQGIDPRSAEHVLENYSKEQKAQEHGGKSDGKTGVFIGDLK